MEQLGVLIQAHPAFTGVAVFTLVLGAVHHAHILLDVMTVLVRHFRAAVAGCLRAADGLWRAVAGKDGSDDRD